MNVIRYKPTIFTTLTTDGVWNSNRLLLVAPIPISSKFRCSPSWGCQQFCICCRHISVIRDKPTIITTFTTDGVWNSNILLLAAPIPISSKFRCSPGWGCQQFCICCRHMNIIRDKPTIITTLTTVWVWNSNILLLAAPIPISSKFRCSPSWGCQQFCICCRHMSVIRDKPTIITTFTTDGVWNSNILLLAAPIPISSKFRCSPGWGCQQFCICCRHINIIRDKPTIITTLTTVWVWNSNILFLAATIPISSKFRCSPSWGCQQFCIYSRHMSVIKDKPTIITTLTTVWVWNSNILLLAAPIPISSKFRFFPSWGYQ